MPEFLVGLFTVTGIAFWIMVAVVAVLITVFEEREHTWAATLCLALFLAGLFAVHPTYLSSIRSGWVLALAGLVGYLVIGGTWAYLKFRHFILRWEERVENAMTLFLAKMRWSRDSLTQGQVDKVWVYVWDELRSHNYRTNESPEGGKYGSPGAGRSMTAPRAKYYKGRLVAWVAYWPFSFAWFLLNDPMRKLGEAVYRFIGVQLDRVSAGATQRTSLSATAPEPPNDADSSDRFSR